MNHSADGLKGPESTVPEENPFAIEACGPTKRFDDLLGVEHLNLEVLQGRIYGFLGPNGAGTANSIQ